MKYLLRAGVLYREADGKALLRIGGVLANREKRVFSMDGNVLRRIMIHGNESGHVHGREYVMLNSVGNICARAHPHYAPEDDPSKNRWPIHRMPTVDHADVWLNNDRYMLKMHDIRHFVLKKTDLKNNVLLKHRGAAGGWNLETDEDLAPDMLVAFFAFCRYLEQENEFPVA